MKRLGLARTVALGVASGVMCLASAAAASDDELDSTWRQSNDDDYEAETTWRRDAAEDEVPRYEQYFQADHFLFELRFGPYWPEVDEEFGGSGPYEQYFGTDARFYFGLEVDWVPVRIPYIGSLGIAGGWGYTASSGQAVVVSTGEEADSDTTLTILPMHLSGVLRLDYFLDRWQIPIVPYGKIGFGLGMWTASGPSGTSEVDGVEGEGTSYGMHLALGGAFTLNIFDEIAATALRESSGIDYVHLYGEWMWANLDGVGSYPQMHIGTSTVVVGLALDW